MTSKNIRLIIIMLLTFFIITNFFTYSYAKPIHCLTSSKPLVKPKDEKLEKDFLIALLAPYITEAIDNYYSQSKQYDLWDAKILYIQRLQPGSFYFETAISVVSFEGPHNPPYGIETVTMKVDSSGVKVIKFNHADKK